MNLFGLDCAVKHTPTLDEGFIPLARFFQSYESAATHPFALAIEREEGRISVYQTALCTADALEAADRLYLDRLAKLLLWLRGGWRLVACGSTAAGEYLKAAYGEGGTRAFDSAFMETVYERPFLVENCAYEDTPTPHEGTTSVGRHTGGCRIGLDAGASNLKVTALQDGKCVFSESYPWRPKDKTDPAYHYQHLATALKAAAAHLPRVDGVGVSSAGVFVGERCMVASLFLGVSQASFDQHIKTIFAKIVATLGSKVPYAIANDGDVTALCGAMALNKNGILGISMGTSQAGGYVDGKGNITGWFNELAFAPIDVQEQAALDEWSGDKGCGVKYLSQDGAVKLAELAGIPLTGDAPADRFACLRKKMDGGDASCIPVYRDLGVYLGHALALYSKFYDIQCALIMGGVAGGAGGDILLAEARRVLQEDYPHITFSPQAPDDRVRQLGQSEAAASLPCIKDSHF